MIIANVAWIRSQRGLPTLELTLDGHPAHIRSRQQAGFLERGIVEGIIFLASERSAQLPNIYIHGDYRPAYDGLDLAGCTDDPGVFALYQEMSEAIRTDSWKVGPRPMLALTASSYSGLREC
jgi:hypothetical protein